MAPSVATGRSKEKIAVAAGQAAQQQMLSKMMEFAKLGQAIQANWEKNFPLLAMDILSNAKSADFNKGAQTALEDSEKVCIYPSKHAFEEEITWLLWRSTQSNKNQ